MCSGALDSVRASVSDLSGDDPAGWTDAEVSAALPVLLGVVAQLTAVVATVVGTFDARDLAASDGTTGDVHITRPDGRPYELGPSRPWTTPTTQATPPPNPGTTGDTGPPTRRAA